MKNVYCPLECEIMSYDMRLSSLENPSFHWYVTI